MDIGPLKCFKRIQQIETSTLSTLVSFLPSCKLEMRAVLVVRDLRYGNLAPEIGGEESISFCDLDIQVYEQWSDRQIIITYGSEGGLQEVTHRRC